MQQQTNLSNPTSKQPRALFLSHSLSPCDLRTKAEQEAEVREGGEKDEKVVKERDRGSGGQL